MKRLLAFAAVAGLTVLAGCDAASSINDPSSLAAGRAVADKGANSDAAQACQHGGWQSLMGSDGGQFTVFTNQGECVNFAARGGTLVPKLPPSITSFVYGSFTLTGPSGAPQVNLTPTFNNGIGTITSPDGSSVTVTSGTLVRLPAEVGDYTLTVSGPGGATATSTLSNPYGNEIDTGSGGGVDPCANGACVIRIPTGGLGRIPGRG